MKKWIVFLIVLFFCARSYAGDLSLYIIYPNGEGDTESAKPYLAKLYEYINEKTGLTLNGMYLNDQDEAAEALKKQQVNIAIVSPEFFNEYKGKYHLNKILKTIPIYSTGPYERFYIMAHKDTKVIDLMDQQIRVNLFASKKYTDQFLNQQIFIDNEEIKKVPWALRDTADILESIKKIAQGEKNTFVLLTGYEFSVISKLRKKTPDFATLKLVYTSKELPSSPLVTVGKTDQEKLSKIKQALRDMSNNLQGNVILKKLRLKGFADL